MTSTLHTAHAPLTRPMRASLLAAGALVTGIGLPLFAFPAFTDAYFAFPIDPPPTAAFLGANYLASSVLAFGAARAATWREARIAVPGAFVFTLLTLGLTLVNLARGEFNAATPPGAVWLAVYALFPPVMAWTWWQQSRAARRRDVAPPDPGPSPSSALHPALRWGLGAIGAALPILGLGLVLWPQQSGRLWPWDLSPPETYAGRAGMEAYLSAWLIGIGIVGGQLWRDNDAAAARPALRAGAVMVLLHVIVVVRAMIEA